MPYALFSKSLFAGTSLANGRQITVTNAAPTSGVWGRGDVVFNNAPSAGGKVGWSCTTGGTAATAWATGTAYTANAQRSANGNTYTQTAASCTSLGSGTGPSGTGTGIADNDCLWDYVSAAAVFKPFGVIDS